MQTFHVDDILIFFKFTYVTFYILQSYMGRDTYTYRKPGNINDAYDLVFLHSCRFSIHKCLWLYVCKYTLIVQPSVLNNCFICVYVFGQYL